MSGFKKAYIEIINTCNLNCDFCPKTKREVSFMDKESFTHVINEVSPYTKYIYFHLMGEPLMHPLLSDFLSICSDKNLKAIITTNGTLIKDTKDILLNSKALHKINISLHSFDKNQNNYSLSDYITEIINFTESARKNTICVLRLWNIDELKFEESYNQNADIINLIKILLNTQSDIVSELYKSNSIKLKPNLYIEKANKFDWPDMHSEIISDNVFCYGMRDQFGILVDGTVVPCCLDKDGDMALGNIFLSPLSEILSSKRAKNIYEGFSNRHASEELCKRCGYAHSNF